METEVEETNVGSGENPEIKSGPRRNESRSENPVVDILNKLNMDIELPKYLLDLLVYTGFDNMISLSELTENDFEEINRFSREELPSLLGKQESKEFYGIYCGKVSKFQILPGHKKLLLKVVNNCQLYLKRTENKNQLKRKALPKRSDVDALLIAKKKQKTPDAESLLDVQGDVHITHITALAFDYLKKQIELKFDKEEADKKIKDISGKTEVKMTKNSDGTLATTIKCVFCEKLSTVYSGKTSTGVKWTLSNFNSHIRGHLHSDDNSKTQSKSKSIKKGLKADRKNSLLNFVTVTPTASAVNASACNFENVATPASKVIIIENRILPTSSLDSSLPMNSEDVNLAEGIPEELFETGDIETCLKNPRENHPDFSCDDTSIPHFSGGRNVEETDISAAENTKPSQSVLRNEKYSRHNRQLRHLELAASNESQTKITEFYTVIDNLKNLMKENPTVQKAFQQSYIDQNNYCSTKGSEGLLDLLYETVMENSTNEKHGNKFSEPLKLFSLYIFTIGGRMLYECLQANLKNALPSITTVNRSLENTRNLVEGDVRLSELSEFLQKREYPLEVFVSEDQTAVIKRIQYDSKSNKMIGFVMPLCQTTGFPIKDNFSVDTVQDIENAFSTGIISNNAYVIMAQPLVDNAPAFCLSIFGSDNRFSSTDVYNRWRYLEDEAKKHGICIVGFSSDGDSRCLRSMKIKTKFETSFGSNAKTPKTARNLTIQQAQDVNSNKNLCLYKPYFQVGWNIDDEKPVCIQDTVHIATKMKTRLLKPNGFLPMGDYSVRASHLDTLIKTYPKDKHLLCPSYLNSGDKMNFEAIDKLSAPIVINLLKEVSGSEATRQFLKLTRHIIDAFLNKEKKVEERVYSMWYSTFFIRLWRGWLIHHPTYNVNENGLTSNTYTCIELNSHGLLLLIEKLRNNGKNHLFLPWLYSSQPCEKIFRQTRSMTSTFSTVVNFGIHDIMRRLTRIQAINQISADLNGKFRFPREESKRLGESIKNKVVPTMMPAPEDILVVLERAKQDALEDARKLGITLHEEELCLQQVILPISKLEGKSANETTASNHSGSASLSDSSENESDPRSDPTVPSDLINSENEDMKEDLSLFSKFDHLNIRDYSKHQPQKRNNYKSGKLSNGNKGTPHSQYLKVTLNNKKTVVVRKSSLCWFFSEKRGRLSADRLYRVRGMSNKKGENRGLSKMKTLKTKKKKLKALRRNSPKRNKISESDEELTGNDTASDTTETSCEYKSESETLSETFSDDGDGHENTDDNNSRNLIKKPLELNKEHYYAVYFDDTWYLGRITDIIDSNSVKMKFLQSNLDDFVWPKIEEMDDIDTKFIFYGPIQMIGVSPLRIKRCDRLEISKKYKEMKRL